MTTPEPLSAATQMLRDAVADSGDVAALPPDRAAAILGIAAALRARGQARRRTRTLVGLSLAAGFALVVGGGALAVHRAHRDGAGDATAQNAQKAGNLGRLVDPTGGVTAVREGHSEPVGVGTRLAEGLELRTASAEAGLDFDTGTHVTIGRASRVRLVEQSQRKRFSLESGSFFAQVAKLKADERFVVATPDAEVEVRGTAFRVTIVPADPTCGGGSPTRLEVSEGVVVVRHSGNEVRVAAGERWPACEGHTATASAKEPASPRSPSVAVASPITPAELPNVATASAAREASPIAASGPESSSRLAEQNDLFDEAMRMKKRGDAAGAMARFDRLLAQYPNGPLAESAEVERMRLLAASDRARAAVAARDYLRHHPRGYGRAEAEAIRAAAP
jgi:hypothetical protein